MSTKNTSFQPAWCEEPPPVGSYRSIFKWGSANEFKHPNRHLYQLIKDSLAMTDEDFRCPRDQGLETVSDVPASRLSESQITRLRAILGEDNVSLDGYSRLRAAYGKGAIDLMRLRKRVIENIPDAVLHPRCQAEIEEIVAYCDSERIPIYIYGGGTSVTRGFEAVKGGVTLDMSTHMNKVVDFNECDQTITVQAGMLGPELEKILNDAPHYLKARRRYTCGHFPQSFEYSTVGGWVVTRGAGQNSTYYGKIEDIVVAQEYVTPRGVIKSLPYPRAAVGPDLNQIMLGSEGVFGVLTNVTLRIFRHLPQNRRYFSYMFKSWEDALNAAREIMQIEAGRPSVFRLSDAEETDVAMKLYGVEGTLADHLLIHLGYCPMARCLLLGTCDGEAGFTDNLARQIHTVCREHGAFTLTPFRVTQRWERDRFRDPYLRDDAADFDIIIDTLECAVTWSQLEKVHREVRHFVKSRPHTICMTHLSHAYPQGGNLYFIFIVHLTDIASYLEFQYGVLEAIQRSGAAMSHHHGLGKQTAPWHVAQVDQQHLELLCSLKKHFDSHNIMNPGGTLGLDMSPEQREKRWGIK